SALTQSLATADQKATEKTVRILITNQGAVHNVRAALGAQQAVTIPTELLSPCPRADYLSVKTAGDLATFGGQQDTYLAVCDARRQEAVGIIQMQNAADTALAKALWPKPWWLAW
ncbi:MAG: hypothetical protein ACYDD1_19970, partial [Caulobacteraceae bacterium]